ncbi:MAG: ABC transporter permease [Solirubrobacterales bacterium]
MSKSDSRDSTGLAVPTPEAPTGKGAEAAEVIRDPSRIASSLGALRLSRYSGVALWLMFIVVYTIWLPDAFPTSATAKSIINSQAIGGLLALAVLFPLAAGVFDLSAAANVTFSSILCAVLMVQAPHLGAGEAIALTLCAGMLIGAFNGFLVAVVGLDSFMATLGTTSLLTAGSAILANANFFGPFPESFTGLTSSEPLGIPMLGIYLLAFAIIAWYVLEHTPVGRRIYAVGANAEAARLAGVRARRIVFSQMVICGLVGSVAAVLLASQVNSTNEQVGSPYLLPAYAAAFLGTTQIKPGRFNVWGTVLAIFLLGTGVQGLQLAGADVWVTDLFNGVALIFAVSVAVLAARRTARRERLQAAKAVTEEDDQLDSEESRTEQ